MKINPLLFCAFFMLFCIGCKNQTADKQPVTTATIKNDTFAALRAGWVNKKYIDSLNNGATLGQVQFQNTEEVTTIDIDSAGANLGFNFHEGMGCSLRKIDDTHFALYDTEGIGEKKYDLEIIDPFSIKVGTATLVKIGIGKTSISALSRKLIGESYVLNQTPVEFKADGTLTGLTPYLRYNIVFDYTSETNPPNQIELVSGEDKSEYFAFEKQGANLTLFDLKCVQKDGKNCLKQTRGKMRWAFLGK